jgi:hypothetical protein
MNPFSESPGIPYTRRTPDAFSVATMASATVAIISSLVDGQAIRAVGLGGCEVVMS